MIKTKDGYGKLVGTAYKGSATDLLLSNGGIKAVSDFSPKDHEHAYLPKTTYEYNKELALGSAHTGKVCIGKFPMYDSNIVVDVSTTTNKSFHGTLVIATQNINTSGGGTHNCVVYGDATNEFTSSIRIKYVSGSNVFSIYCNFPQWSKSLIHIKAMALAGTPTDIVTAISDIPADATIIPTNALSTNYAAKSHTHTKADITDFSHNHDAAYLKKSGDQLNTGATLKFDTYGNRFLTISGNSIAADMSADTGTWAGAFATVKSTKETTTMLGWYGSASGGLTHIFMGGSYDDPAMKMTPAGVFTFKNTIQGSISGSAGSVAWSNVSGRPTQLSQFTYNLPVKMINDPGQAVLKASHGLNTNYGTGSYGHPTAEYLQAFLHYLQTNASGYTCIGTIGPNSQGAYICHVYSSGFNTETGLPEHATGHFFQHGGSHQSFGTSYGVWYTRYFLDTSNTSVTSGVGKINGVEITNVQKDSEGNVIKDTYLKRSGGTMNGSITLNQTSTNRRVGLVGSYDPNKAAAIWSMGESYQIATDGSNFGTLYGAAYAYYGTGYTFGAGKANGHSFLWCQAGTPTVALGNNVWTSGGFVKSDSSNDYVLLGGGGHKAVSDFAISGHDHNGTYLPLSGGTMTGAITMNTGTGIAMKYTSGGNDVWMYPNGAPTYGIRYFEGSPDKMAFSATSNNDDITKADLCINGNGDGTVTIRGNNIWHAGNDGSGSGLDADTLDGKQASDFALSSHGTHVTGVGFTSGNSSNGSRDCDAIKSNGHWYYSSNGPDIALGATTIDGALYSQAYSTSWVAQIAQDYRNGNLYTRSYKGDNSHNIPSGWQPWRKVAYIDDTIKNAYYMRTMESGTSNWYTGWKAWFKWIDGSTLGLKITNANTDDNTTASSYKFKADLAGTADSINVWGDDGSEGSGKAYKVIFAGNPAKGLGTSSIAASVYVDGRSTDEFTYEPDTGTLYCPNIFAGTTIKTASATSASKLCGIDLGGGGARLTSYSNNAVLLGGILRFSTGTAFDYNEWAGLKYTPNNKIIYLGIADNSAFAANQAQSGGKIYTPGISNIYIGNGSYTVLHSNNYSEYAATTDHTHNFTNITPGNAIIGDGANYMAFRSTEAWRSGMYYHTTGDESMVFANKNNRSSWMFVYDDPASRPLWTEFNGTARTVPSLQIRNQCVTINKLMPNTGSATKWSYNLDVGGTANFDGAACSQTELAAPLITTETVNATTVNASSGFFQTSDESLKQVIRPITVDLDKLTKLRKVYFKWNDQTEKRELQLGMIAQDVQKLYPELVNIDSDHLSLAYDKLSVIALKAIDELYVLIKDLQKENQELKQKLNSITN